MVKESFDERRHGVRVKRIITIRYRLVKRGGRKTEDDWHLSVTEDMSVSGLLFSSSEEYKKDDILEMQVVMSGVLDIFNGYGQVVRAVPVKNKHTFHVGVQFTDVKPKSRSAKRIDHPAAKKKKAKKTVKKKSSK